LEECEEFIRQHGEPEMISGQQEHCEAIFNRYL
jgi:xylose isomerase